eukprot:6175449-Pleurochrysis_carterae.AAC.1
MRSRAHVRSQECVHLRACVSSDVEGESALACAPAYSSLAQSSTSTTVGLGTPLSSVSTLSPSKATSAPTLTDAVRVSDPRSEACASEKRTYTDSSAAPAQG